jgi:hypothetical protein
MQKLKTFLKPRVYYTMAYIEKHFLSEEVKAILEKYDFTLYELCYRLKHDIPLDKIFLCLNCHKKTKFRRKIYYQKFCCHACAVEYINKQPDHMDKVKAKCMKLYKTDNVFKLKEFQDKAREGMLRNHNVEHALQSDKFLQKCYATKKKNKTSCSSEPEKEVGRLLCLKFKDVRAQFKSDEYPFACDYYVADIDTYIECNFHISHGKNLGIFDSSNPKHIKLLNKWKSKNTEFYRNLIYIWTVRDPYKLEVAKKNNIKLLIFWDLKLKDFMLWYNKIKPEEIANATF